jgi:hypothetical protein
MIKKFQPSKAAQSQFGEKPFDFFAKMNSVELLKVAKLFFFLFLSFFSEHTCSLVDWCLLDNLDLAFRRCLLGLFRDFQKKKVIFSSIFGTKILSKLFFPKPFFLSKSNSKEKYDYHMGKWEIQMKIWENQTKNRRNPDKKSMKTKQKKNN